MSLHFIITEKSLMNLDEQKIMKMKSTIPRRLILYCNMAIIMMIFLMVEGSITKKANSAVWKNTAHQLHAKLGNTAVTLETENNESWIMQARFLTRAVM